MKKLCFLSITIFLFSFHAKSQDTKVYEIKGNITFPVFESDILGNRVENSSYITPPSKSKFSLIRYIGDNVVIRFLSWSNDSSLMRKFNVSKIFSEELNDSITVDKYFIIDRYDLDSNSIKVFSRSFRSTIFSIGVVTMPTKLRMGKNFDFQGNLSLGTTAGGKMRISKYNSNYLNILFGASISTVSLDSFSTKGKVPGQPISNVAVFSPSIGFVFEFSNAQAGIFYGWDFLNKSSQNKYEWIYNKKPWISIGFGFSILSINSESNNQNVQGN